MYEIPNNLLTDGLCYGRKWFTTLDFFEKFLCKSVNDYFEWEGDIFSELTEEELNFVKKDKIVLDSSWNSYNMQKLYFLIHESCIKNNIPEQNIILLTANLSREYEVYANWFSSSNYKTRINTFPFPIFLSMSQNINNDVVLDSVKYDKFVTFSRNPRNHRNVMNYKLLTENLPVDLSQSAVDDSVLQEHCKDFNVDFTHKNLFEKNISIDRNDYDNSPVKWTESHSNFLAHYKFVLAQDTVLGDYGFYMTEKVWKGILYERPIIIWGQTGANHYLKEMGFKLYDKFFDLSFDFEKDNAKRLSMLVEELKAASVRMLDKDWLDRDKETLEYNRNYLLSQDCLKEWLTPLKAIAKL